MSETPTVAEQAAAPTPPQGPPDERRRDPQPLAFMLTRLSGDLAISIAGPQATQADVEIVRKAYGLDRPLTV